MNPLLHYEYGKPKKAFISTWRTSNISTGSSSSNQIKLPLIDRGTYNFRVDWGDGSTDKITNWNQSQTMHTYSIEGDYTIKITGTCSGWRFGNTGDKLKILSIKSWGRLKLESSGNQRAYFFGCENLDLSSVSDILDLTETSDLTGTFLECKSLTTINNIDKWDIKNVMYLGSMFAGASNFDQNLGAWNVSNVIEFSYMFGSATKFNNGGSSDINNWTLKTNATITIYGMFMAASTFNQPIGNWNISAATNLHSMFSSATSFNQNIGRWNTENIQEMLYTFSGATNFNQDIGTWNTSKVTNMAYMFAGGAITFNQNIGGWNVSNVTDFQRMFNGAYAFNNGNSSDINNWILKSSGSINMNSMFSGSTNFNQPIGNWNTSKVTNMTYMFSYASNFDQNINTWDISNVTSLNAMFLGAGKFNQNIGKWNVSNVTDFSLMFQYANAFNNGGSPDINNWTLKSSGVINMNNMFFIALNFNQPIGNWNTSTVTNMSSMFVSAVNFNQNIGAWNVSNVTNFQGMFDGKTPLTFSSSNLDAIYNGWSSRPVKSSISIKFGTAKFTSASSAARAILTGVPNNWIIYDGGITA